MKKLITTALATLVAFYAYSQTDYLPLTGGTLSGELSMTLPGNGSAKFTNASTTFGQIRLNNSLTGGKTWELQSYTNGSLYFNNQALQPALLLNDDKTVNLFGSLTGTSANFGGSAGYGGIVTIDNSSNQADVNHGILHLRNSAPYAIGNDASIMFTSRNSDGSFHPRASFGVKTSGDFTGDFVFNARTGHDSWAEKFRITSNGNVGIGITTPTATLEIARGAGSGGTAVFRGTDRYTHFNYSVEEDTYIRGGKATSNIYLNDNGGNVAIGATDPKGYKLAVAGKIRATEIKVEALPWSDFVFEPSYKLRDLKSTEQFIKENKHLPEIPSAAEVAKDGINVGEMSAKLLQKIEELTLHMIEQNKESTELRKIIQLQNDRIANLEKQIKN